MRKLKNDDVLKLYFETELDRLIKDMVGLISKNLKNE